MNTWFLLSFHLEYQRDEMLTTQHEFIHKLTDFDVLAILLVSLSITLLFAILSNEFVTFLLSNAEILRHDGEEEHC